MDSIIASKSSLLFIPRGRTRRGIERTREARAGEVSVVASMAPATSTQLEQLDELTDEMFAEALATSTSGDVQPVVQVPCRQVAHAGGEAAAEDGGGAISVHH